MCHRSSLSVCCLLRSRVGRRLRFALGGLLRTHGIRLTGLLARRLVRPWGPARPRSRGGFRGCRGCLCLRPLAWACCALRCRDRALRYLDRRSRRRLDSLFLRSRATGFDLACWRLGLRSGALTRRANSLFVFRCGDAAFSQDLAHRQARGGLSVSVTAAGGGAVFVFFEEGVFVAGPL